MKNLTYSFITPHHNNPEFLNRLINSIPERNDLEIIVVDDNSDPSKKPVNLRSDVKLISIDSEHSKGAGHARNLGMQSAHGRWLLFPDSDDFYEKGFLDELDKYANSNYDIVYFGVYYSYDLVTKQVWKSKFDNYLKQLSLFPNDIYIKKSVSFFHNEPWCKMLKKKFINDIKAVYEEVPIANDAWFSMYVASKTNNIAGITNKLYYWVRNPKGLTNSKKNYRQILNRQKYMNKILQLRIENGAWNTIDPLWRGFGRDFKSVGFFNALFLRLISIKDGYPLIRWFYHYILDNIYNRR